jgi:indolepyruvate decarboxylase
MTTLAHALLTALKDHGAHEIFGIPGDFVLPLFRVIEESNILPSFTLSHEPAVGFAADASARYHGGLGVAVVTYGAGGFNIVNSIAGAYAERSPVVVIARAWRARANQWLPAASPGAHGRYAACRLQGNHLRSGGADRSHNRTCADRAGVAQRARNVAAVAAEVEPVVVLSPRHADAGALAECAEEILERIEAAGAPVVVVDVEIRRYGIEDKIAALARKLNLPLVTTFMGRGLLEHSPDVVAGTYLGAAGDPAITRLVEDADRATLAILETNQHLS